MADKRSEAFGRESVEFARVLTFSDGLFAIAMTLLVVGIEIPSIPDTEDVGELWEAVSDLEGSFISFFISFAVIGRYWVAHHQFFSLLARMDRGLMWINLIYLCFIAFLPFPTGLLGNFFENPLAFAIYSVAVAVVSGMEVVLFRHAQRHDLLKRPMPEDVYRYGVLVSFSPVIFFLASIPLAFLIDPAWAVILWFGAVPFQIVTDRWKPEGADQYLTGI